MICKAFLLLISLFSIALPKGTAAQEVILSCNGGRTHGGGFDQAWVRLDNNIGVTSVQFDLLFDTDVLTIESMSRTYRTEHFVVFEWEPVEEGVCVLIADSARIIEPDRHGGSIAQFSVRVRYGTPPGSLDLSLGRVEIRDSHGNDIPCSTRGGTFTVLPSATLRVLYTAAVPGSRENLTTIDFSNSVSFESIRFDLLFDTHTISVSDVLPAPEAEVVFPDFTWYHIDGGIHVVLPQITGSLWFIYSKPLCYMISNISSDAQRSAYYSLTLSDAQVTDYEDNEIPTEYIDGEIYIPSYDASLYVGTGRGQPGDTDVKVWIELSRNYCDLTAVTFDLLFDTQNISIRDVERTETSAVFADFEWYEIPGGSRLSMNDEDVAVPRGKYRSIAAILFDIAPDAPRKEYALNLSNPVLLNSFGDEIITTADDGIIYVVESMILSVEDGGGFPGSGGNMVSVLFESDRVFTVIDLLLSFDTERLSVTDVKKRTIATRAFLWEATADGLLIFYWTSGTLPVVGPIADISFQVQQNAPLGDYNLAVDSLLVVDAFGGIISTERFDGTFSVIQKGDVNGDGSTNVRDVVLEIRIILETHEPTPTERSVADCNDDDRINVLDIPCIVHIILGK
jgi:hypothetical protein